MVSMQTAPKINEPLGVENDLGLISMREYRSILRKCLDGNYFKEDIKHYILYFVCMFICITGIFSILSLQSFILKLLVSVVMGIALSSLTFFLHDLMHGSITKSKPLAYVTGLSIGIFNLFAPLFWQRVHNLHHTTTGNVDDPDRSYISSESPKNLFEKVVYKTRISDESYHPFLSLILMSTGFFWYFSNTMFYGLIGGKASLKEDKKYSRIQQLFKKKKDKAVVLFELLTILSFQVFLFVFLAKCNFVTYFLISLLPILIAHFTTMLYIHTNHFLSPLTGKIDDPLINSLSIKDSWLVDKVYSNFSHHVEHHLFPSMSSAHYPKVRKLLLKHYSDRFKLIPMYKAVRLLFKTPRIYGSYTNLVTSDGSKKVKCLIPDNKG